MVMGSTAHTTFTLGSSLLTSGEYSTGLIIPEWFDITNEIVLDYSELKEPETIDYSDLMPPIKNQSRCGSCYAFASLTVLEAHVYKSTGKQIALSEGQIIDCSYTFGDMRCSGGFPLSVFAYIKKNGVCPLEKYPYYIPFEFCKRNACAAEEKTYVKSYGIVEANTHASLAQALKDNGPLVVGIDASTLSTYKQGIFQECPGMTQINHAVALVGLVKVNGEWAWKIQNSWGDWGSNGFFYLPYNQQNDCAILDLVTYVRV